MNDYKRILLVVLTAILLFPVGFAVREAINDKGEKNARMYNTAIQASEQERFNYAIDSHQGKLLGHGQFNPTQLVKFPEMSKQYAAVDKTREEYTRHEREVCETKYRTETHTESVPDGEGGYTTETVTEEVPYEECHTEEYYSWDDAGTERQESPTYKLHGRDYPADLFNTGTFKSRTDACEFTKAGENMGWLDMGQKSGCADGYYYTDDKTRFEYHTIAPEGFSASFIADVSTGALKPLQGSFISLERRSIEEMVKSANDYKMPGNAFIIFWWILILGVAGTIAYAWVMQDGKFE